MVKSVDDRFDNDSWRMKAVKGVGKGAWWLTKNSIKYLVEKPIEATWNGYQNRKFDVLPQEIVAVLNHNYEFLKDEAAFYEIMGMISLGYDALKIYKEKPELFAKGAKVLGPRGRKYFKWFGQKPIRIETDAITIDPPPTEETAIFKGYPLSFLIDTKIKYKKHPILFPYLSGGKLFRNNEDWQDELHKNIVAEAEDIIHNHFQIYQKFPEVLKKVSDSHIKRKKDELLQEYGVDVEIKVNKFRPSPDQKEIISQMLTNELASSVDTLNLNYSGTQRIPSYRREVSENNPENVD